MKKVTLIIPVLLTGVVLFGQHIQQKEADVRAMEQIEAQALLQKDIPTLKKIWSPNFMVNAPLNMVFIGGQVELVQAGIINYSSFVRNVEHVMVLKDVVITMGSETVVPAGADPMAGQTIQRRYTNIWIKEKSDWILVARHANDICTTTNFEGSMNRKTNNEIVDDLKLKVMNNPSRDNFYLELPGKMAGKINLRILESNGRLMEKIEVSAGSNIIQFGDGYQPGIYFVEVSNGMYKKSLKLIKL